MLLTSLVPGLELRESGPGSELLHCTGHLIKLEAWEPGLATTMEILH